MQRIALGIEYNGSNYFGWQRQRNQPSIQAIVESALSKIANHPVSIICAGRTDAGVHASGQVIHFNSDALRPGVAWVRGVNNYLPTDIRVLWSKPVPEDFNARRSALSRRYSYIIANRPVSPGILCKGMSWIRAPLDINHMQAGAEYLLGSHDFSSFRAAQCQAKSPIRTVTSLMLARRGDYIILDITANAFLHHMVRNIVGTLVAVGQGKFHSQWVQEVLQAKDRRLAGFTATPYGLYLVKVTYPSAYQLPIDLSLPWFLSL